MQRCQAKLQKKIQPTFPLTIAYKVKLNFVGAQQKYTTYKKKNCAASNEL